MQWRRGALQRLRLTFAQQLVPTLLNSYLFLNDFHNCLVLHELSVEKRKIQSLLNKIEKRREKSSSLASDPLQSFDKHMYWTDQAAQARATLPLI